MPAIAFDMTTADLLQHHPKGISQAYRDIGRTLKPYGCVWVQGSAYLTQSDDLANLIAAILALKNMPWIPSCVRDIRVFKVEHWSDITSIVKGSPAE